MDKEIRQLEIDFRANEENRTIEGCAIPFNVWSPNREGFRERILPSAVEGVIENSDIKFLYNHASDKGFLARYNKGRGKLAIDVREDGVYFSFPAKKDNLSNYVYDRIQTGELNEMSFAFTVANDVWEKGADGVYERTITNFGGLYDLSVVDSSYYGIENAVKCARFAEIQEEERIENERLMKEAEERAAEEEAKKEEEKKEALKTYYEKIKEDYKEYLK